MLWKADLSLRHAVQKRVERESAVAVTWSRKRRSTHFALDGPLVVTTRVSGEVIQQYHPVPVNPQLGLDEAR